jgi:SAM-dependent methyltransferase
MPHYGILMFPSYNRVYFQSSKELAAAELEAANGRLLSPAQSIAHRTIAGVDYITFETDAPLSPQDIRILSRLSFVYALFELRTGDTRGMIPLEKDPQAYFEEDINTILKYSGKTNEAFTKLMVNLGWLLCDAFGSEEIHLLDPICGKGTTLFQGMIYGFHTYGVEIDKAAVQQAATFLTRYLKTKRYKHQLSESKLSENNKKIGDIYRYALARSKEDYKEGRHLKTEFYRADTLHTAKFFKKNSIDILIGDLPYGVQHGSNTQTGSFTRNPEILLKEALPIWHKVLKPGAALILSWNTFVLKKETIADILSAAGYRVYADGPYNRFSHRVDQAIIRDLIAAKKT